LIRQAWEYMPEILAPWEAISRRIMVWYLKNN
jgi:hypothetical protein